MCVIILIFSKFSNEENIILKQTKRARSTTTVGHYVTNATLFPAVVEAKALGKVTNKLIKMIQMIAERYSRKSNFGSYSFREDMVAAAVMNLCNNALKFNPEKSNNPFSFYTTAIHNSFLQYMADEKKHRNIRDALLIDAGSNPSFNFLQGEKDESHFEIQESDEIPISLVLPKKDIDDNTPDPTAIEELLEIITPKEERIGYSCRAPGEVTVYGPDDIIVDEFGNITIKENCINEKCTIKKSDNKTKSDKKFIVKKVSTLKVEPKQVTKKVVDKKAVDKKTVAKKTTSKNTEIKKAITKKTAATKKAVDKKVTKKDMHRTVTKKEIPKVKKQTSKTTKNAPKVAKITASKSKKK